MIYHWRKQVSAADTIIARVGAPKMYSSAASMGERKGLDLSRSRLSLAQMLAELAECHECARVDFETRSDPNKPKKRLEDNFDATESGPDFDYGEHAGVGLNDMGDWPTFYRQTYARSARNPGTNRTGGPPLPPAHVACWFARDWWRSQRLGKFNPSFDPDREQGESYDENKFNAPARFLFAVLKYLDPSYKPANARSAFDYCKKKERAFKKSKEKSCE